MENYLQSMMNQGQNRAPNTIRLRKIYTDYATETASRGDKPMGFEEWAKVNYPDLKILNP